MTFKREAFFWALAASALVMGFVSGGAGIALKGAQEGLYLMLFSALFLVLSGIFTSVAIKYQQEKK